MREMLVMCYLQYVTVNVYPDVAMAAVTGRLNYSVVFYNTLLISRYIAALVRQ